MHSLLNICDLTCTKFGTFERYLIEMAAKCRRECVRLGILFPGEPIPAVANALREQGVRWWSAPSWKDQQDRENRRAFLRSFACALREDRWDALLFQFCSELSVSMGIALARFRNRERFASVWVQHSEMVPPGRIGRYLSRMRALAGFVDGMIVLSARTREAVQARGWRPDRLKLIRNGIAIPSHYRRGWLRAQLGLPDDAYLIVCVGSLIHRKAYDILLPALAPELKQRPNHYLLVLGDGPLKGEIQKLSQSLGIESQVHLLGLRDDVPDILADSDLFTLASRAEGLTLSVIEAMAAGLPVVVTDVGGHSEIVSATTGWITKPNDTPAFSAVVAEALANPVEAQIRGQNAQSLVSAEFSLEVQVESQLRFIESIWNNARGNRVSRVLPTQFVNSAEVK